jgi:uncharacterized DUF497 family protein
MLQRVTGFDWDAGNLSKSAGKHGVTPEEAEELVFRSPLVVEAGRAGDPEPRFAALGFTERGRRLRVVFTIRRQLIRPISCRIANRREIAAYEEALRQRGP